MAGLFRPDLIFRALAQPFNISLMLVNGQCPHKSRNQNSDQRNLRDTNNPPNHVANGSNAAAAIEATETYFVSKETTIHVTNPTTKAIGINPASTPAEVAIPLPPLNFNQQV